MDRLIGRFALVAVGGAALPDRMSVSRPHVAAFVAGNDTLLIDDRAATRERRYDLFEIKLGNTRRKPRDPGRARSSMTCHPTGEGRPVRHVLRRSF
jgi:hypothetical protein